MTITGAFAGKVGGPNYVLSQDMKTLYSNMGAEAKSATFAPTVNDTVDLMKSATMNITKPLLGACQSRPKITCSSARSVNITFTGSDPLPTTACKDWAEAVKQGGLTAVFTDTPYLNGGKAMTVTLELSP